MSPRPRRVRLRLPLLAVVGVVMCGLLLGVGLIGYGTMKNYLRGEKFRRLVEQRAGAWLGSEVTMAPLNWSGASVYLDRAGAVGGPASAVDALEAESLRTGVDVRALLSRTVRFEPVEITRLVLKLKTPTETAGAASDPVPAAPAWWQPRKVELGGLRVEALQLDSPWLTLSKTRAVLPPDTTTDYTLSGGTLRLPGLPETALQEARLRLMEDRLHLLSSSLTLEGGGVAEVDGVVEWIGPASVDLQAQWRQVKLVHFLPEPWHAVLHGQADGEVHYVRSAGNVAVKGTVRSHNATVGVVPVLKVLAEFTSSERFAQVPVQELSADFSSQGDALELEDIVMESSGLIRLEGACRIVEQTIEGDFLVGISPSVLRWIPASYGRVFAEDRGGYRWTTMRVSGPLSHPSEDLSARLLAAIPGAVIEEGLEGANEAGRLLKDGVGGALDAILGF